MKKFKWSFLAIALIAVFSAFATQTKVNLAAKKFQIDSSFPSRILLGQDITGWTKGVEYDCDEPETELCTITVLEEDIQYDEEQRPFVDVEDVLSQEDGVFVLVP